MQELFQMSDLGLLSYYLGIEVQQAEGEIRVSQSSYAAKTLEDAGMTQCNPCCVPMENCLKLMKNSGEVIDATRYQSMIGSLRYLVNTRPDLAYAVGVLSRFMEAPGKQHWAAMKQVLRYVQGTQGFGCTYREGSKNAALTGFSDSDHAGDLDDRKSTTGLVFFFGSSVVTWASQKQRIVAMSSCEAEYIAAATAASQAVWLSRLLSEMIGGEAQKVKLRIDNQSAIELSKNPVHHERTKHIDLRYHFIRECVEEGKVDVEQVRTSNQLADILTKPLGRALFTELRDKLGINLVQQIRGDLLANLLHIVDRF
jgi:hypothetical protein